MGNLGHIFNVDSTWEDDLTRAMIEGRKLLPEFITYYNTYVGGAFEKAYPVTTAATLGVRESRRILGDYALNLHIKYVLLSMMKSDGFPTRLIYTFQPQPRRRMTNSRMRLSPAPMPTVKPTESRIARWFLKHSIMYLSAVVVLAPIKVCRPPSG